MFFQFSKRNKIILVVGKSLFQTWKTNPIDVFFFLPHMISQMENRFENLEIVSWQNFYSRQITIHKHGSDNN